MPEFNQKVDRDDRLWAQAPLHRLYLTWPFTIPIQLGSYILGRLSACLLVRKAATVTLLTLPRSWKRIRVVRRKMCVCCFVLLLVELILRNRYGPRVSSRASQGGRTQARDPRSPIGDRAVPARGTAIFLYWQTCRKVSLNYQQPTNQLKQ